MPSMDEGEEEEGGRAWTNVPCHKRTDQQINTSQPAVSNKRPRHSPETLAQGAFESPNRFTPLSGSVAEPDKRPPPIYVKNVNLGDYRLLVTQLRAVGGEDFECQATRLNGVTIYPKTAEAYRAFVHYLKGAKASYHTFQLQEEKPFRVVIRHLHPSTEPQEIIEALTAHSHQVRSVVNVLQSGTRIPLPLFFVDLEPKVNNSEIMKLKSLLYTRIAVEEPRVKRDILQCKRCLQYGHSRTYCNHSARCARCGKQHLTSECSQDPNEPRKCALCQGSHSTTYRGCQVYKDLRSRRHLPNIVAKANQHIVSPSVGTGQPADPVAFRVPNSSIVNSRRHTQSERVTVPTPVHNTPTLPPVSKPPEYRTFNMSRTSARDPRLTSASYAQVLSSENTRNVSHSPESPTLNHTNTDITQWNLQQTLNLFFTRFQDLLTPLITALNLLITKLLA